MLAGQESDPEPARSPCEPRVFVACDSPRFDTTRAARYGRRVFMLGDDVHPLAVPDLEQRLSSALAASDFDPTIDFVCMTGAAVVLAVLAAVCAQRYGTFWMLVFDAKTSRYVARQLVVGGNGDKR